MTNKTVSWLRANCKFASDDRLERAREFVRRRSLVRRQYARNCEKAELSVPGDYRYEISESHGIKMTGPSSRLKDAMEKCRLVRNRAIEALKEEFSDIAGSPELDKAERESIEAGIRGFFPKPEPPDPADWWKGSGSI
jgi:hypothetical protein